MTTNQDALHADLVAKHGGGTPTEFNEDWLLFLSERGVTQRSFNEGLLEWLNDALGSNYTSVPSAQTAFAVAQGVTTWSEITAVQALAETGLHWGGVFLLWGPNNNMSWG